MSKMKDLWGDKIIIEADPGEVVITFVEVFLPLDGAPYEERSVEMNLDSYLTRKLIKKLKKSLAEMEDM